MLTIISWRHKNLSNPNDKRGTVEQLNDSTTTQEISDMFNSYGYVTKINNKISKKSEQRTNVHEIQVIYGDENVKGVLNEIISNCKSGFFLYAAKNLLSVIFGMPPYREMLTSLQNSKVKIKLLTEITADNLEYCKQFMKDFGAEIRHLKGIKGNFALTTELYIALRAYPKIR